jgi:prophage regulatory protein
MERILRIGEVREITGLARTTIWRLERERQFPARLQLASRSVGWLASEVMAWLETRTRANPESDPRAMAAEHVGSRKESTSARRQTTAVRE